MEKRVGFIGLGIMGMPMARNLIKAGAQITMVYKRSWEELALEQKVFTIEVK